MRLRILSCLLLLAACFDVMASDLYTTINLLHDGDGNCEIAKQLGPLKPQAALERVAKNLARGKQLEQSLRSAEYRAARVNVLNVHGNEIDVNLAEILAEQGFCQQLQDAAMKEVGIYQDARQVWIVMAAPLELTVKMDEQSAGQRVLDLVNQTRVTRRSCGNKAFNATQTVRWNDLLADVSRLHSNEMARFNYLSHYGRDGSTPAKRVERAGYRYRVTGENIAAGQISPEDVVAGWINSPTHCANLMNPAFTEMGVAFAVDHNSKMGVYWTQEFGTSR